MLNKKLTKFSLRKETISNLDMARLSGGVEERKKVVVIAKPTQDTPCRYEVLAGSPADTELVLI